MKFCNGNTKILCLEEIPRFPALEKFKNAAMSTTCFPLFKTDSHFKASFGKMEMGYAHLGLPFVKTETQVNLNTSSCVFVHQTFFWKSDSPDSVFETHV